MTKEQISQEVKNGKWQPEFEFTDNLDDAIDDVLKPHEDYLLKPLHDKVKKIIEREIDHQQNRSVVAQHEDDLYQITFADACNFQNELFKYKSEVIRQTINQEGDLAIIIDWNETKPYEISNKDAFINKVKSLPNQYIDLGLRTKIGTKVGGEVCNGKIRMFDTPDNRDIWVCKNCNKEYSFDFNIDRCNNIINAWEPPHPMFLNDLISMCFPIDMNFKNHKKASVGTLGTQEDYEIFVKKALTGWYKIFEVIHFYEDLNGRVGGIIVNILSYILTGHYLIKK